MVTVLCDMYTFALTINNAITHTTNALSEINIIIFFLLQRNERQHNVLNVPGIPRRTVTGECVTFPDTMSSVQTGIEDAHVISLNRTGRKCSYQRVNGSKHFKYLRVQCSTFSKKTLRPFTLYI